MTGDFACHEVSFSHTGRSAPRSKHRENFLSDPVSLGIARDKIFPTTNFHLFTIRFPPKTISAYIVNPAVGIPYTTIKTHVKIPGQQQP